MPALSLPGRLWPVHLKPLPDELLSSWLGRLAAAHGLKLHTFCTLAFGRRALWNRDLDRLAPPEVMEVLAERTATPPARVRETTLARYE
ncbi:MAG: TniQ family protein, partial [Gemmatimonadota bacterium]|nr:TniQ family protein [Gemmatimonadota bacterium]